MRAKYTFETPIILDYYKGILVSLNRAKLDILGDEMMGDSLYYETGPYGSFRDGSWFTDFWQDLNGRNWQPIHWPEIINIRSGDAIDG